MAPSRMLYIIPTFLLMSSICIVFWTGYVVRDSHEKTIFIDSPNYIPIINVFVGFLAFIVFLTNYFRVFGCTHDRGCCDSGLSWFTFIIMIALGVALFIQVCTLNESEMDLYKNNLKRYYELTIGQCCYFIVYLLLVLFQYICQWCKCCSNCVRSNDDYDIEDNTTIFA